MTNIYCKDLTQDGIIRLGFKHGIKKVKEEVIAKKNKRNKKKSKKNKNKNLEKKQEKNVDKVVLIKDGKSRKSTPIYNKKCFKNSFSCKFVICEFEKKNFSVCNLTIKGPDCKTFTKVSVWLEMVVLSCRT